MNIREGIKTALESVGFYRSRLQTSPFPGVAVLGYHGVRDDRWPSGSMQFETLHVTASRLDEHCRVLRDLGCTMLTLREWSDIAAGGAPPPRAVLLTFDDGYRTVLTQALPILERHGMPAAVFACCDPIQRRQRFWFDALAEREGEAAVEILKTLPYDQWRVRVEAAAMPVASDDPHAPLAPEELRQLAAHPLIEIGAHTATHPILACAPLDVQIDEIRRSRRVLEEWLDRPVTSFAYPNGRPGLDYTADTKQEVARCGFDHAFAVWPAFAEPGSDRRFDEPRFLMLASITGPELAHRLAISWPRQIGAEV